MWQSIVKKQMRYNRNMDVHRKVVLFFETNKLDSVVTRYLPRVRYILFVWQQ